MASRRLTLRVLADVVTTLVLVVAATTVIYRNIWGQAGPAETKLTPPADPVALTGSAVRGSQNAKAVLIVYSDFQCPYCGRFARDVFPEIQRRYVDTGRVSIAFRHLPLPIHPQAVRAAVTAECAGQQNRFWEMHDLLFAQKELNENTITALADSLDLDKKRFEECVADASVTERVTNSVKAANAFGINGTPAFFVGTREDDGRVRVSRTLSGALPFIEFERAVDAVLSGKSTHSWKSWIPFLG